MSRIGKHAVTVPSGVEVAVAGQQVTVKGALGELSRVLTDEVEVTRDGDDVWVKPRADDTRSRAMWGMSRTVVNNMVLGVSEGFSRTLEINGVGYGAAVQGNEIELSLGFNKPVRYSFPTTVTIECPNVTTVIVRGCDKQQVGLVASEIRKLRPPEPYKGKGIKYSDETIRRKAGKAFGSA